MQIDSDDIKRGFRDYVTDQKEIWSIIVKNFYYDMHKTYIEAWRDVVIRHNKTEFYLCVVRQRFPVATDNMQNEVLLRYTDLRRMVKALPESVEVLALAAADIRKKYMVGREPVEIVKGLVGYKIEIPAPDDPMQEVIDELKRKRIKEELK